MLLPRYYIYAYNGRMDMWITTSVNHITRINLYVMGISFYNTYRNRVFDENEINLEPVSIYYS